MITRKDEKEPEICIICAWRQDCQKKFSLAHGQKCLEFTRDLTLKGKVPEEKPQSDQ
jgi:hypothetical protein